MIRTKVVKLSVIKAIAYRQKLPAGGSGIVILREDAAQPGIASISKTSGEAIPTANTQQKLYPLEAFREAIALTAGFPYKKQGGVDLKGEPLAADAEREEEEPVEEEVVVDSAEYQKIVDRYTDKNGRLSYELLNRDMIKFAHSSSKVRAMIEEGESVETIRLYTVGTKFRNITGNQDLTDAQVLKMTELLDEVSPKGVFREFNDEIRRSLKAREYPPRRIRAEIAQRNTNRGTGMDKKTRMETLARESRDRGGFNGAWLYAEKGEIVSRGALGFRDAEGKLPIEEDTIFQLASVSKQFTATAVMLLIREGKLSLDDRITKFFPELAAYEGVTIRHLLSHTGGVPDYFEDEDWFIRIWKEEKRIPRNSEIVRFLCETKLKPKFAPGEKLDYSNTGYNLLAETVERVSGVAYEEFLRQNIFEPAGMSSTRCCHVRRDGAPFANYARALVLENGRYVPDVDSAEDCVVAAFDGLNGDDYVYTNIFDMLAWDRALREGKVLSLDEQRLMYTPAKLNSGEDAVYDEDEGLGYGFGWGIEKNEEFGLIVSHSGGMPGVITWFERFIDADRTLVYLLNREPEDFRAVMGFWTGMQKISRDREPEPVRCIEEIALKDPDKSKWESFCGSYEHPEGADFIVDKVWMKDGELYAKAIDEDGDPMEFRLYPIGENEFGRKGGMLKLKFGEGCLMFDGRTCKKL